MSDGTAPRRRGLTTTHKRLLGGAGSIAIVVLVFVFVLPRIADYRDVLDVLRDLDWQDWAALAAAVLLNLATFPPPWMAALPGLGYREGMAMTQASTALSIVSPAGAAVGMAASYSMLRSWKFGASAVGLAVAITGVWNQFANLVFPVVALALLTAANERHPALQTAALIAVVILAVAIVCFRARPLPRGARPPDRRRRRARMESRAPPRPPGPGRVGWRVVRELPQPGARPPCAALARHHGRDARGASHGVRPPPRLPARDRCHELGGHRDRSLRRVGARADPGSAAHHARRSRCRRGGAHGRSRGVRRPECARRWPPRCSTARSPSCRRSRSACSRSPLGAHTTRGSR